MTETYKIKAYSRTTSEDDASKLTRYEYNGSFQANVYDIDRAFNAQDRDTLLGWSKMMDCFFDCIFIRVDTDETISFNEYEEPKWTDEQCRGQGFYTSGKEGWYE